MTSKNRETAEIIDAATDGVRRIAAQRDIARQMLVDIAEEASRGSKALAGGGSDASAVRAIATKALGKIEALGRAITDPAVAAEPLSEEAQKAILSGEVDLDGHVDLRGVEYIGNASRQPDGTWRCLAKVGTALCVVECRITFQPPSAP